jgi:hypothetical protein
MWTSSHLASPRLLRIVREKSVRYLLRGTRPSGALHKRYRTLISRSLLITLIGVGLLMFWPSVSKAEKQTVGLDLVRADGLAIPIVLAEDAAPYTREAALEMASHIESIGGVRPQVLEGMPHPIPEHALWVGYQPVLKNLFPNVDFNLTHPEEVLLVANDNHIAITGRDRWDPMHDVFMGRRFPIKNKQQEYGNANAVYTFLQEIIGVRWLYPGDLGTDYPSKASLRIKPFEKRHHPQFRSRSGLFNQLELGYIKRSETQDWAKHQRVLLHSLDMLGGHYFKDWWEKYGETRPELFALQPDGTRGTYPVAEHRKKLCEGEPAVWELWLKEQESLLEEYPHRTVLAAMPNDGYFDGHCTDPRSRAWDPDPSETDIRINLHWADGVRELWPPLSDRYVTFANKLAELAEKRFPDKEFFVSTNAYGDVGRPKPVRAVPRDNVLIIGVNNFHGRDQAFREKERTDFLNWSSISKAMIWRPNLGNQGGRMWGLPDVPFDQLADDFRFVAEHGVVGVFFDTLFEHWATMAPYYYLVGQLAWDPSADHKAILDDYFQRCYGPAAAPMKEYWLLMEATRGKLVDTVASPYSAFSAPDFYDAEFFATAEALVSQAESLAKAADGKYAQRVEFTRCGLVYTKAIIEIRESMQQFEKDKKNQQATGEIVLRKWTDLEQTVNDFPEFAINFKRMSGGSGTDQPSEPREKSSGNKRVMGLHPASPVKASALRSVSEAGLDLN